MTFVLNGLKEDIILCGIGRETVIDFEKQLGEAIENSHDIEFWIFKQNIYDDYKLQDIVKRNFFVI